MRNYSFIKSAKYLNKHKLEVVFDDGVTKTIDLGTFIKNSNLSSVKKYKDINLFKEVRVEDGTVCWGDNEFDISPFNIYAGKYDAK